MAKAHNVVRGSYHNIVQAYNNSSIESRLEGERWYDEARLVALQVSKLVDSDDVRIGAGIIAALSPQINWGENIVEALKFTSIGYCTKQTPSNNAKAIRILAGEDPEAILGGEKVVPFYHAIVDPRGNYKAVVDRHVMRIYYGKPVSKRDLGRAFSNPRVMHRMQTSVKIATKILNQEHGLDLHYNVVQATVWVQERKNEGLVRETGWETNYNIPQQELGTNQEQELKESNSID